MLWIYLQNNGKHACKRHKSTCQVSPYTHAHFYFVCACMCTDFLVSHFSVISLSFKFHKDPIFRYRDIYKIERCFFFGQHCKWLCPDSRHGILMAISKVIYSVSTFSTFRTIYLSVVLLLVAWESVTYIHNHNKKTLHYENTK